MKLRAISIKEAKKYFTEHSSYRADFNAAISVWDAETGIIHGVIALNFNGDEFMLGHIHTDGNAHAGSLLYGGAWRTAKALGYDRITI